MNRIKFITAIMFVCISCQMQSQTLHAIIFGDRTEPEIGPSVAMDCYQIDAECRAIAAANNMKLMEYSYLDEECTIANANKVLNNLRCGADDVVFFYYSGHGARSDREASKFPQLFISRKAGIDGFMPLYRIDEKIAAKSPKFRIVMADCCNSIATGLSAKDTDLGGKATSVENAVAVLRNLFSNVKGSVIVSSSKAGETSSALPNGGAFTIAFLKTLQKIVGGSGKADWKELMDNTRLATITLGGHTPVFDINVTPIATTTTTAVTAPAIERPDQPSTAVVTGSLVNTLKNLADDRADKLNRINLIKPAIDAFFASPSSVVEVYGRNAKTLVTRESAEDFLNRVSTSYKLIDFAIISEQKNGAGKITYLKLHEIYK